MSVQSAPHIGALLLISGPWQALGESISDILRTRTLEKFNMTRTHLMAEVMHHCVNMSCTHGLMGSHSSLCKKHYLPRFPLDLRVSGWTHVKEHEGTPSRVQ